MKKKSLYRFHKYLESPVLIALYLINVNYIEKNNFFSLFIFYYFWEGREADTPEGLKFANRLKELFSMVNPLDYKLKKLQAATLLSSNP